MRHTPLAKTPLDNLHRRLGAKMVPFTGYEMPIQYPTGIMAEHHHTRKAAGLFDVSHMGALEVEGDKAGEALEQLIPCDLVKLLPGQMRYGVLMVATGGVFDDLLITRQEKGYLLVVNASRKLEDLTYLKAHLGGGVNIRAWEMPVMVALQGPKAAVVLTRFFQDVGEMPFMTGKSYGRIWISRSGYTGEDGFEILAMAEEGLPVIERLLEAPEVKPVGLGARDSLRLEAGLCLYGHELTEDITPVEAGISWSIGKRRRQAGGFFGADKVLAQIAQEPFQRRVGLTLSPGGIPREGSEIMSVEGKAIGVVSSGGYSPTLGYPIAMGYVESTHSAVGSDVFIQVRERPRVAKVVKLPFVPQSYYKK